MLSNILPDPDSGGERKLPTSKNFLFPPLDITAGDMWKNENMRQVIQLAYQGGAIQAYFLDKKIPNTDSLNKLYNNFQNMSENEKIEKARFFGEKPENLVSFLKEQYGPFVDIINENKKLPTEEFRKIFINRLEKWKKSLEGNVELHIRSDRFCYWGIVYAIARLCQQHGIDNIYFDFGGLQ
jgi:hypothetical protein